jgi:hypothetical protein
MSDENLRKLKKEAQEQNLAVVFLLSAGCRQYWRLLEDLYNDFLQGQDWYPKTLTAAFSLLAN